MKSHTLPLLPPKIDIETKAILKAVIPARTALAELKIGGRIIPNDSLLIHKMTLLEAKDSSAIENIFTTRDALFRADIAKQETADPNIKEVQRYRNALWHGVESIKHKPLCTNTFVDLFRIIKNTNAGVRSTPGTVIADGQGNTIYTPPEGEATLRELLANLETFLHADDDVDPLIKMAILHYQFEAIHPFTDGNGRTGRIINILYLLEKQLLDTPALFLSRYIIDHKADYYRLLRAVTEQHAWEAWILYILKAVEQTAMQTNNRIKTIHTAMQGFQHQLQQTLPNIYSKDLVELLFSSPYTRPQDLIDANIANSRVTAARYLQAIVEHDFLEKERIGKEVIYINQTLIKTLTSRAVSMAEYVQE